MQNNSRYLYLLLIKKKSIIFYIKKLDGWKNHIWIFLSHLIIHKKFFYYKVNEFFNLLLYLHSYHNKIFFYCHLDSIYKLLKQINCNRYKLHIILKKKIKLNFLSSDYK